MTKFVSVIGNGESRRGFDITPLKSVTTMVGCNALFRDHNLEYRGCVIVTCARRPLTQLVKTQRYTPEINGTNSSLFGPMSSVFPNYHTRETRDRTNHSIGVQDSLPHWLA